VVIGRGGEVGALLLRRRARGHELVAAAGEVAVATAAEELDALGDDLHSLPLARAVGRLPLAPVEPAVDSDRATLREVLRAALRRQRTPAGRLPKRSFRAPPLQALPSRPVPRRARRPRRAVRSCASLECGASPCAAARRRRS